MSSATKKPVVGERYVLGRLLGSGGAGQVFEATDRRLERRVAIKLLSMRYGDREDARKRFLREAKIGAQLSHENLIQTYDFGYDGERLYLAMEYLEGRDLCHALRERGTLTQDEVLLIAEQVSAGLALAHHKGLVHRDLKPENIFLISEDPVRCKVIDFGMAIGTAMSASKEARVTLDGSICGTPHYMAPEQLRGEAPVAASDVYALGCVLYQLLTGAPPYDLDALGELAARHLFAPIPRLEATRDDVAPILCELVRRCLGKVATARPSMEQVHQRVCDVRHSPSSKRQGPRITATIRHDQRSAFENPDTPTERVTQGDLPKSAARPGSAGLIAILGDLPGPLRLSLLAAGYGIVEASSLTSTGALLCIGASDDELATGCQLHKLVLADAEAGDMERIAHLLRIGVSEVITRPISADTLITKLRRAIRIQSRITSED